MKFESLASSSAGNLYTICDEKTKLLIECGLTLKEIKKRLDFKLSEYNGCLVSHEHKDHSKAAKSLTKEGLNVYMSGGTAAALGLYQAQIVTPGEMFGIGSFDILPFKTFHDASEPLGFLIRSKIDGERMLFATDTVNLGVCSNNLDYIAVEANFDNSKLIASEHLPEKVKHRIQNSHFEINMLCNYLKKCDLSHCKKIFLLHLSDNFGHENTFAQRVQKICRQAEVTVCKK